jgi:hypothetical protein
VEIAGQQVPAMNPAAAQAAAAGQTVSPLAPATQGLGTSPVATNQIFRPNDRTTSRGVGTTPPIATATPSAAGTAPAATPQPTAATDESAPVALPQLRFRKNASTNDILAEMSRVMSKPSTSKPAASKLYELQTMLFQAHKDCLAVWTSARNG